MKIFDHQESGTGNAIQVLCCSACATFDHEVVADQIASDSGQMVLEIITFARDDRNYSHCNFDLLVRLGIILRLVRGT